MSLSSRFKWVFLRGDISDSPISYPVTLGFTSHFTLCTKCIISSYLFVSSFPSSTRVGISSDLFALYPKALPKT